MGAFVFGEVRVRAASVGDVMCGSISQGIGKVKEDDLPDNWVCELHPQGYVCDDPEELAIIAENGGAQIAPMLAAVNQIADAIAAAAGAVCLERVASVVGVVLSVPLSALSLSVASGGTHL